MMAQDAVPLAYEFHRRAIPGVGGVARLDKITHEGKQAWVKRPISASFILRRVVYNLPFDLIGAPRMLHNIWLMNADAGLKHEAERLRHLSSRGHPVPLVLDETPGQIIISDVGQSLDVIIENDPSQTQHWIKAGAKALAALHNADEWHGDASLHNMAWNGQNITFFDFESDPLRVMSHLEAQARDVWYLARSTAFYTKSDEHAVAETMHTYFDALNVDKRGPIQKILSQDAQGAFGTLFMAWNGWRHWKRTSRQIDAVHAGLKAAL